MIYRFQIRHQSVVSSLIDFIKHIIRGYIEIIVLRIVLRIGIVHLCH